MLRLIFAWIGSSCGQMEFKMEKKQERVLAYRLATAIDHKTLDEVSGGSGAARAQGICMQLTGDINNHDTIVDL